MPVGIAMQFSYDSPNFFALKSKRVGYQTLPGLKLAISKLSCEFLGAPSQTEERSIRLSIYFGFQEKDEPLYCIFNYLYTLRVVFSFPWYLGQP